MNRSGSGLRILIWSNQLNRLVCHIAKGQINRAVARGSPSPATDNSMASATRAALLPSPSLLRSASAALLLPPPMIASSRRTLSSPSRRLLLHPAVKPTRPDLPTFRVRAARTESGSVSLGFRAPHFEVLSLHPLTLFFWFLGCRSGHSCCVGSSCSCRSPWRGKCGLWMISSLALRFWWVSVPIDASLEAKQMLNWSFCSPLWWSWLELGVLGRQTGFVAHRACSTPFLGWD